MHKQSRGREKKKKTHALHSLQLKVSLYSFLKKTKSTAREHDQKEELHIAQGIGIEICFEREKNYLTMESSELASANRMGGGSGSGEAVMVVAKFDYAAQDAQELDMKKNDKLILLDDSRHWWRVQNTKNQTGTLCVSCEESMVI